MQAVLEFAPIVVFVAAYVADGLYTATAALMIAMAVLLAVDLVRERRIRPMHGLSAALVFGFGAATLILRDPRFIQWKPTVFYWLVSVAFLGSIWIGRQLLVQRLLGSILTEVRAPEAVWRRLNWLWIVFYALLGALNLAFVFYTSETVWAYSKPFFVVAAVAFLAVQAFWLMKRYDGGSEQRSSQA